MGDRDPRLTPQMCEEIANIGPRARQNSGVYILAPVCPRKNVHVKVGSSKQLKRRLDKYFLYYPEGFYIYALFITRSDAYKRLEKSIQAYLNGTFPYLGSSTHRHTGEWFTLPNPTRNIREITTHIMTMIDDDEQPRTRTGKKQWPYVSRRCSRVERNAKITTGL